MLIYKIYLLLIESIPFYNEYTPQYGWRETFNKPSLGHWTKYQTNKWKKICINKIFVNFSHQAFVMSCSNRVQSSALWKFNSKHLKKTQLAIKLEITVVGEGVRGKGGWGWSTHWRDFLMGRLQTTLDIRFRLWHCCAVCPGFWPMFQMGFNHDVC